MPCVDNLTVENSRACLNFPNGASVTAERWEQEYSGHAAVDCSEARPCYRTGGGATSRIALANH
jgi:hypothetical protein